MSLVAILFALTNLAHAFTLNNNFNAAFSKTRVKVMIAGNTTCANINMTVTELESLIDPAINKFWNKVPTSKLRLKASGFSDAVNNIDTGRLCAPTDEACISEAGAGIIPPTDQIIIGCNNNSNNFDNTNVLAITLPNKFSGHKIKGSVILINDKAGTLFAELSESDKISVLAHEIGHAIGLGHSSDNSSLMYYKTVNLRRNLGQDDIDGVSYLYPVKIDGCGAFGGSISEDKVDPQIWQMGISLALMIALINLLKKLFRGPKRGSST